MRMTGNGIIPLDRVTHVASRMSKSYVTYMNRPGQEWFSSFLLPWIVCGCAAVPRFHMTNGGNQTILVGISIHL